MTPDVATTAFAGPVPENYDRYLVPILFEPYADDLVARLKDLRMANLLEIGCGTGVVTRRLRDALPASVEMFATDLNRAMVTLAQKKFRNDENLNWREANFSALPFPDQSFDCVVSQFCLMFVPDKDLANREAFRVLRTGGVYLFNLWDSLEHNPVTRIAHETIIGSFDRDPPLFYETPHGYFDRDAIQRSLEAAGFADIEVDIVTRPCRSRSANDAASGLVRGTPVSVMIQERGGDLDKISQKTAQNIGSQFGNAPVEGTMRALVWKAVRR